MTTMKDSHFENPVLERTFQDDSTSDPRLDVVVPQDFDQLENMAAARVAQGFAPPPEIYRLPYRNRIDWGRFPEWARPINPDLFEGSVHEG